MRTETAIKQELEAAEAYARQVSLRLLQIQSTADDLRRELVEVADQCSEAT